MNRAVMAVSSSAASQLTTIFLSSLFGSPALMEMMGRLGGLLVISQNTGGRDRGSSEKAGWLARLTETLSCGFK